MQSYTPEFCASIPLEAFTNESTQTLNKKLTGSANPRTLVKPTISPPSHDITVWRQNPNINHSQINEKTTANPSLAGFTLPKSYYGENDTDTDTDEDVEIEAANPYMIPLQPNIYTNTDDFQPINNNLGIAYPPQFPNTTVISSLGKNTLIYDTDEPVFTVEARDFELIGDGYELPKIKKQKHIEIGSGPDSVYDPRFVGYGSGNRGYEDKLLGSAKFYYDDINAVRMPSYITRNKLDSCSTPCGDRYGDLNAGYLSLYNAKKGAEQSWRDNSLNFRVDLTKSLMRKKNEEMVQKRLAPKYTLF